MLDWEICALGDTLVDVALFTIMILTSASMGMFYSKCMYFVLVKIIILF